MFESFKALYHWIFKTSERNTINQIFFLLSAISNRIGFCLVRFVIYHVKRLVITIRWN